MSGSGSEGNLLKFAQAFEHEAVDDLFREHWGVKGSTMTITDTYGHTNFYIYAAIEAPSNFRFDFPSKMVHYQVNWFIGYP